MRNISLFIAMSLDEYIADSKGWLAAGAGGRGDINTYSEFIKDFDTIITIACSKKWVIVIFYMTEHWLLK